jgi:putative membrane protein
VSEGANEAQMTSMATSSGKRTFRVADSGFWALSLFAVAGLPDAAVAQSGSQNGWYQHMGHGFGHMMGWGWGSYGGIRMILFWILLIAIVLFLLRRFPASLQGPRSNDPSPHSAALEILKERYAKGEISKEEYEARKRTLMQ